MRRFLCVQPGCDREFDAAERPTHCPECRYPFGGAEINAGSKAGDDELPWTDYTVDELLEYCESWEVEGWTARTPKAELIALLEAAEAG